MAEKPIIFSTEMVKAILDGRKTQTRRVCKEIALCDFEWALDREPYIGNYRTFTWDWVTLENVWLYDIQTDVDDHRTYLLKPKYQPGDHLWVRETWAYVDRRFGGDDEFYVYRASEDGQVWEREIENWCWRPSIHMPKEAARIWLKVTGVRVERLQGMTEEDARGEGCITFQDKISNRSFEGVTTFDLTAREAFKDLWNSINAKRGYGWETNPWVWVIEFEKLGGRTNGN